MSEPKYGICNECGCSITQGHYRHCSLYVQKPVPELIVESCKRLRDGDTNTELNQDIVGQPAAVIVERDEAVAKNRVMVEAFEKIQSKQDEVNYSQDDYMYTLHECIELATQVLTQSPVELYKAQMAVIEAAKNTDGLGHNLSKLMKALVALNELEHNRGGS